MLGCAQLKAQDGSGSTATVLEVHSLRELAGHQASDELDLAQRQEVASVVSLLQGDLLPLARELLIQLGVVKRTPLEGLPDWRDVVVVTMKCKKIADVDDDDDDDDDDDGQQVIAGAAQKEDHLVKNALLVANKILQALNASDCPQLDSQRTHRHSFWLPWITFSATSRSRASSKGIKNGLVVRDVVFCH